MKKTVLSLIASLAIASSAVAVDNKVYATVNGETITSSDIAVAIRDPRAQFDTLPKNQKDKILDSLIEQKLLSQDAMKSNIPNTQEFKDELKKLKQTLAFQLWMRDISKTINPTDKEVKKFYNENKDEILAPTEFKASHILVKTQKEADDLIKRLEKSKNKKATFTKLAKEKSIGPSGKSGGELGWFTKDKMVPEFSNATALLSKGTITKTAVKTQFGYHIIYLDDKRGGSTVPFKQVKAQLKQNLSQKIFIDKLKEKAAKLKEKAKITYK